MNLLKKYILPEQIDFFGKMKEQVALTKEILDSICDFYKNDATALPDAIHNAFAKAEIHRKASLLGLNRTFITPVDKEAISRVFFQLNRCTLKLQHLLAEIEIYKIYNLKSYTVLLELLKQEMSGLDTAVTFLKNKKYFEIHQNTDNLLALGNKFSKEYATALNELFDTTEQKYLFQQKEIVFQLKEINHSLLDVNYAVEDIVFKMN